MVIVYGAEWCEDTRRSRRHLRRLGVRHLYVDVDQDTGALERAKELNNGRRRTPTIDIDSEALVEPRNETLTNALIRHAEITEDEARDRMQVQNVGDFERVLRASAGGLLLALAPRAPRGTPLPIAVLGTVTLLTGVIGWCPAYAAAGVSSIGGPGDHPDEAEREGWITNY